MIRQQPFALTEKQKAFWKKLYYNGLGEFLYLNSITVSEQELMEIEGIDTLSSVENALHSTESMELPFPC